MIMASLVDAGVPLSALRAELGKLPLEGWTISAREVRKGAFRATKVDVEIDHHAHRHHRSLGDILDILERSSLEVSVKARAARIFTRLAEAEARVHGTDRESVHFHDVGAVDAIIDVTGGIIALDLAGVEAVHISALPIGGGLVGGPHGRIPVPGPGTAELLRGFPVVDTGVKAELVTPTGAAILTTLAASAGRMPSLTVEAVGYGAGTMDLPDTPNILRCFLGATTTAAAGDETVLQVETTIDDMSPQLYEPLLERLLESGALDAWLTPVIMKRSRPGVVLTALCEPGRVADLSRLLFEESPTIGVRWTAYQRARLEREMVRLDTAHGPVTFKVSRLDGRAITVTPEFEEIRRIARDRGLAVREVLEQARTEGRRLLSSP